ncbi:hypothetical protein [Agromyces atrinae]|uniref:Uncharacterized protein n=1 Tax=Agromyces atrinae TaxID=592376 RepID=A0A4Q2M6H3_9MICO|nr:hypothetical protein [Agromyces atrinae]NYD68045.1 hypothetical protein [Agromyces atrinae]RXZ87804.1 hypothetical protein ESP50_00940 [Agromyces atrinae]
MNTAAQFNTDNGCYTVKKMSDTLFAVSAGEKVLGFVERAGSVWVASRGRYLSKAVEVAQSPDFDLALHRLEA